ncbi:hypothetical protein NST20_05675 [Weizmannia sp. FSL W8-0676]|uniref:hypothetical protein n=1 Tax=unclassified Heyndrickxia TaxID=2837518 RepID=UPI0030FC2DF8
MLRWLCLPGLHRFTATRTKLVYLRAPIKDQQDEEYTVVMKLEDSSHMSLSYVDEDGELADDVIHLVKTDK